MKEESKKTKEEKAVVEKAEKKVEQRAESGQDREITKKEKQAEQSEESKEDKQLTKKIIKQKKEKLTGTEPKILSIKQALAELKKEKKRKFSQSIDLIINLKDFDIKKQSVNLFVSVPFKIKQVKIGAFLEGKSKLVDTVTKPEFVKYQDKKEIKKLLRNYDFFIANAKLMPAVATSFGRVLGPQGKMPSPQLGIITDESETSIKAVLAKLEKVIRIKTKEPSIKICIGKEDMKDEDIEANIKSVYSALVNALPRKKENLKDILIKFTMTKPLKIEVN